jgi:TolA-binding protein
VSTKWIIVIGFLSAIGLTVAGVVAQSPSKPEKASEVDLVEQVIKARKDYWLSLDRLRQHYVAQNEIEKANWVEDELKGFHRVEKYSYRLDVKDVPPATLQAKSNVTEANTLFRRAIEYKNRGFGDDYIDNQRRAEILLQGILERYPDSDKIAEVAYHLGDIYEHYKPRPQFERAAAYYERSFQWNKASTTDARLRAARIFDRQLKQFDKAKEMYKAVANHDTNSERVAEAERRLREMGSRR